MPSQLAAQEYQVLDPPLVSEEDWTRAQVLLDRLRRSRAPRQDPETIPATYKGFMRCGLCNGSMLYQPDSRDYGGYYCGRHRRHGCPMGQVSVRLADPQLDTQLERMLGSEETLMALVARAAEDAARRAECSPAELQRRTTQLENQRARVKDAYVAGAFELPELQRLAGIDGELAALRDLMDAPGTAPLEVDAEAVRAVAEVFCWWRDLPRAEKRDLLRAFQIQLIIEEPARGQLRVVRVEVGSLGHVGLYKKMKRYGIE